MKRLSPPCIEPLESRIAPATFTWVGLAGDGNWFNATNWDENIVPGITDTAILGISSIINLTDSVSVDSFDLRAGTLSGVANLTILSNLTWTGGTMEGTGVTNVAGSGSTVGGTAQKFLGRVLNNSGTLNFNAADNANPIFFGRTTATPGVFNNTGTVNVTAGGDIQPSSTNSGHAINNSGTWNVTGAGTTSTVSGGVAFNNTGTVNVGNGTLALAGGGTSTGSFGAVAGGTLQFDGGTHQLNAGSSISAGGTVEISAGTWNLNAGSYNVTGTTAITGGNANFNTEATTSSLTLSSGTLAGSGVVSVTGDLTWTGGTMEGTGVTNVAGSGSTVGGTAQKFLGRVLNNSGTLNFNAADNANPIFFGRTAATPGVFNNTGTVNVTAGGDIQPSSANSGHVINNSGTWNVTGAGTTSTVSGGVAFNNTGTVNVGSGTLELAGGGTSTGSFGAVAGGTLQFDGGTHQLNAGSSISAGGTVEISAGTWNLNAGSYNVTGTTAITGGNANFNTEATTSSLTLSSGTLAGSGVVSVTGDLTWTGGTMEGTGVTNVAGTASTVGGTAQKFLGRVLNNSGTLNFDAADNANPIFFGRTTATPGVFNNTGTVNVTAGGDIQPSSTNSGHAINNSGTWNVTGAGTTSTVSGGVAFNNTGTVNVGSGTLALAGGGTSTGSFGAVAGGTLQFDGGTHQLNAGSSISAGGTVEISAGTWNLNAGSYNMTGTTAITGGNANFNTEATTSSLTLSSGILAGSGVVTVTGDLTWTGGTMEGTGVTNVAGTASTVGGTAQKFLGRVLNNSGTLNFNAADNANPIFFGRTAATPGVFNNTGTVNVTAGGDIQPSSTNSGHAINNSGTWNVTGAGTTSTVSGGVAFNNTGTVNVGNGTLALAGGGTSTGSFGAVAGGTLQFDGGTHQLNAGSSISAGGTVEISAGTWNLNAGSYNVTGTTAITGGNANFNTEATTSSLTLSSGTLAGSGVVSVTGDLTWTGGTMEGTGVTNVAGTASTVGGTAQKFLGRVLNNSGTLNFNAADNANPIFFGRTTATPGVFNNTGTVNVTAGGDIQPSSTNSGHAINNSGTWNVTGAGTTSTVAGGIAFNNTGVVRVEGGKTLMNGPFTQSAGITIMTGGILESAVGLRFLGGELLGDGLIVGDVTNTGALVRPGGIGRAGALSISGDYVQNTSSTLAIEIGGTIAGTQYDQLNVAGSLTLGGILRITFLNGFAPGDTDVFTVATAGARVGAFAEVVGSGSLTANYTAAGVQLVRFDPIPSLSINDVTLLEGGNGTANASFTISLSGPSTDTVTVHYFTAEGSATAPSDFIIQGLTTLTFAPGEISKTVSVAIVGDTTLESAETFFVNLINPSNATILDAQGQGTILNDDAPVVISPDGTVVTVFDLDGDEVSIKTSKGVLSALNFVFSPDGALQVIDLRGDAGFSGANLSITAKLLGTGDGLVDVGLFDASNLNLGKVSISGNLGQILAGDGDSRKPALRSLTVGSLGTLAAIAEPLLSQLNGSLLKLTVAGDVRAAAVDVLGKLGITSIGGSVIGDLNAGGALLRSILEKGSVDPRVSGGLPAGAFNATSMTKFSVNGSFEGGSVTSAGNIKGVTIGGDLHSSGIAAAGQIKTVKVLGMLNGEDAERPSIIAALAKLDSAKPAGAVALNSLLVNGDVQNAQVLLGYQKERTDAGVRYLPQNADASAGKVVVKGDWEASSLVAGVVDATGDGFGQNDTGISGGRDKIVARIASIVIKGTATGSIDGGDQFAITAQQVGKLKIAGEKIELNNGAKDDVLLDPTNGDFRLVEI